MRNISVSTVLLVLSLVAGSIGWYLYFEGRKEIRDIQTAQLDIVLRDANSLKWRLNALIEDGQISAEDRISLTFVISEFSSIDRPMASTATLGAVDQQRFEQLRQAEEKAWKVLNKHPLQVNVEDITLMVQAIEEFVKDVNDV